MMIHMAHKTDIKYAILIKKLHIKKKETRENSSDRINKKNFERIKQKKKVLPSERELIL